MQHTFSEAELAAAFIGTLAPIFTMEELAAKASEGWVAFEGKCIDEFPYPWHTNPAPSRMGPLHCTLSNGLPVSSGCCLKNCDSSSLCVCAHSLHVTRAITLQAMCMTCLPLSMSIRVVES
jgi:hypothetical protein